jgi:hypothetical protein
MSTATEHSILDTLRAGEAELAVAVDETRARISLHPEQLHDARSKAIYAKPNVRTGAELNGEVAKITAREKKDLAALNGLEGDLSAVRSILAVEAQRESERTADAARKQLAERHDLESRPGVVPAASLPSSRTPGRSTSRSPKSPSPTPDPTGSMFLMP